MPKKFLKSVVFFIILKCMCILDVYAQVTTCASCLQQWTACCQGNFYPLNCYNDWGRCVESIGGCKTDAPPPNMSACKPSR